MSRGSWRPVRWLLVGAVGAVSVLSTSCGGASDAAAERDGAPAAEVGDRDAAVRRTLAGGSSESIDPAGPFSYASRKIDLAAAEELLGRSLSGAQRFGTIETVWGSLPSEEDPIVALSMKSPAGHAFVVTVARSTISSAEYVKTMSDAAPLNPGMNDAVLASGLHAIEVANSNGPIVAATWIEGNWKVQVASPDMESERELFALVHDEAPLLR